MRFQRPLCRWRVARLDFCYVIPGSTDAPRDAVAGSLVRLGREVLPALPG
jgi:hypothetical protein